MPSASAPLPLPLPLPLPVVVDTRLRAPLLALGPALVVEATVVSSPPRLTDEVLTAADALAATGARATGAGAVVGRIAA